MPDDISFRYMPLEIEASPQIRPESIDSISTLSARLGCEIDFGQIQLLFDQVSRGFFSSHSKGPDPLLVSLSVATRGAGLHYRPDETVAIYRSLKEVNIPVGAVKEIVKYSGRIRTRHYYFVLAKHMELVTEVLKADEALDKYRRNPVVQVFGPEVKNVPSTTLLVNSKRYIRFGNLLKREGLFKRGPYKIDQYLSDDCPVPVFMYKSHFYPAWQDQLLADYIRRAT